MVAKKCKLYEIYQRMCDVEKHSWVKNVYKWAKLFKKGWNSIQDEDMSYRPTMVNIFEMVYSGKALILTDRKLEVENISEWLGISMGTAHKIVLGDLTFSKVSCCWISPGYYKSSY